jgi:predicted permease
MSLRWWRRREAELDEELRRHLELAIAERVGRGESPAAAEYAARREMGNEGLIREATRRMWGWAWLEPIAQDARYAVRALRHSPVFAVAAVLSLALGIGANMMIFGLLDALLLRPLPGIRAPEALVEIRGVMSYPAYRDFLQQVPQVVLAGSRERQMALSVDDQVIRATGAIVSGNYFQVLGAGIARGRGLTASDDQPGATPAAVLSDLIWRRSFGADTTVIGRKITVNGAPVIVVGVAEPRFRGLHLERPPAFWLTIHAWPLVAPPSFHGLDLETRTWGWVTAVGRLRPGVTTEQVRRALEAERGRQHRLFPNASVADTSVRLLSSAVATLGDGYTPVVLFMRVLMGVVALVLLIACTNVANLLLARAAHRGREIALRLAIGASRGRLVRQLLTESIVLALVAGLAGLGLFVVAARALNAVTLPGGISGSAVAVHADTRILIVAAIVTAVTGLLFGLAPALHASRADVIGALKDAAPAGMRLSSLRGALVSAQVAMSLVLLIGAALFARGLRAALTMDPGFTAGNIAMMSVNVDLARYDSSAAGAYYDGVVRAAAALPGVRDVAWTRNVPLANGGDTEGGTIEGYVPQQGEVVEYEVNWIGSHLLRILGIPITRGRGFSDGDTRGAPDVAVVNESFALRYFAGRDPIGRHLKMGSRSVMIVGVARDAKYDRLDERPHPYAYLPLMQSLGAVAVGSSTLLVRTAGDPESALGALQGVARLTGPTVPIFGVGTFGDQLDQLLAPQRIGVVLLGAFAMLALVVSAVGVYGVVAYTVSRLTRDIGIRIALGAQPAQVIGGVLRRHVRQVALGVIAGLALAAGSSRALAAFLYGTSTTDAVAFGGAALVILAVGLAAAYLPARRASRVDPLLALRVD